MYYILLLHIFQCLTFSRLCPDSKEIHPVCLTNFQSINLSLYFTLNPCPSSVVHHGGLCCDRTNLNSFHSTRETGSTCGDCAARSGRLDVSPDRELQVHGRQVCADRELQVHGRLVCADRELQVHGRLVCA